MLGSVSVLVIAVPVYCKMFPGAPLLPKSFETYTWPLVSKATLFGPTSPGSVRTDFFGPQFGPNSVIVRGPAPSSGTHRLPDWSTPMPPFTLVNGPTVQTGA